MDRLARSWVPEYLTRRGLTPESLERWQVGYAPGSGDALTRYLRAAGYDDPLIVAAGLARSRGGLRDLFRDRAMFPVRSPHGAIVGFIGRAAPDRRDGCPKYLNSPATTQYTKKETLFGLWEARGELAAGGLPVIAEGPLDVVAISQAAAAYGSYAPVAPCGSLLTASQAAALAQAADLAAAGVLVAFDADKPGRRAAASAYRTLTTYTPSTQAMIMPLGYDPARLLSDHGPATLAFALDHCRRPLADLVTDAETARWTRSLQFAEVQVSALRAIAPTIAAMPPSDVARQVTRLAAHLGLDHALVTEAVAEAVTSQPVTIAQLSAG
jgi:DNA primase